MSCGSMKECQQLILRYKKKFGKDSFNEFDPELYSNGVLIGYFTQKGNLYVPVDLKIRKVG